MEYTITLQNKKNIAENILELKFNKPPDFNFIPGQFVQFIMHTADGKIKRAYSIVSIPEETNLVFIIKLIDDGRGSKFLNKLSIGQSIKITEPTGLFISNPNSLEDCFIATGAGLSPIISMVRDNLEIKKITKKINLIFGVRYKKDIFLQEELKKMSEKFSNFSYQIALSKPDENWKGLNGRVTNFLPENIGQDFYICGNPEMVKEVFDLLLKKGVDNKKIHFEIF